MCGIYGSTIKYSDELIYEKLARVNFRGPDFSGFKQLDGLTLGHNRLSVVDLDPRSNQPFCYLHLHIVFNGEIYNYLDIRKKLKEQQYQFRTGSDTEVVCAAYLAYGADCVNHFNGMFAFVIYDPVKKELFGARDRLGKKPFYYTHSGTSFEFASQPAQLSIGRALTINESAIHEYLVWNNIPEPRSIYQEVNKLPAAHRFTFDLFSGKLNISRYWDLDYNWENKFTGTYLVAKQELSRLLTDAVKIRMFADVPLGVFLSGGIDSSLITALAVQQVENVKTFSVKFNENGFDESVYAEKVARHLGTQHHTIVCDYKEGIDLIENVSRYYDEPFADSSAVPSLLLSKHTRKHVTVALSGDAGDEAFLGYHRYKWINDIKLLFHLPLYIRKAIGSLIRLSPKYRHQLIAMGISMPDIETLYVKVFGGMENSWVSENNIDLDHSLIHVLNNPIKPLLERVSDFDIKTYLNGDINTKVDRASMAFSLESRSPLMDYRIIEFSRTLPTDFKFYKGNQKRILKDLLFEHVPAHFFNRPKAGFTMPFQHWFRKELRDYVQDHLSENELKNIPGINVTRTLEIIQEHLSGRWNRYPQIWKLLVLAQWLKGQKKTCRPLTEMLV